MVEIIFGQVTENLADLITYTFINAPISVIHYRKRELTTELVHEHLSQNMQF